MSITDRINQIIAESKRAKLEEAQRRKEKLRHKEQKRREFKIQVLEKKGIFSSELDQAIVANANAEITVGSENKSSQALRASETAKETTKDSAKSALSLKQKKKSVLMERLHKVISRAGVASVRKAEELIAAGRVSINGEVAKIGQKVDVNDKSLKIRVDGNIIRHYQALHQPCRVLIYHKDEGEICTRHDPEGRTTVFERLPRLNVGRWVQVGRLDVNTSGLLLFTNDGELAHRLMHPSYEVQRKYLCRVYGEVTPEIRRRLLTGVQLEDGMAKFNSLEPVNGMDEDGAISKANKWYEVTLNEGRNQEVRRLFESQELVVSRLIRNEYAGICLDREYNIPKRGYLEADLREINHLRTLVGLPRETVGADPDYTKGMSKSEIKRGKAQFNKKIRRAINKDRAHYGEMKNIRDERTKDRRARRDQIAEKISRSNKSKFKKAGKSSPKLSNLKGNKVFKA